MSFARYRTPRDRISGKTPWLSAIAIVCLSAPLSIGATEAGFFGDAQAVRGGQLYEAHCALCHGSQLEGKSSVPLAGEAFVLRWAADDERSVDDLYYIIRTQMPYGEPGKLTKAEYLDIVAFVLKVNGYPGGADLVPQASMLSEKKLKRSKP